MHLWQQCRVEADAGPGRPARMRGVSNEESLSGPLRLFSEPLPSSADSMSAITLHEPWVWLVAEGFKVSETRSWRPPARLLGELIAMHAAKRPIVWSEVNSEIAKVISDVTGELRGVTPEGMPFGAVVATARLSGYLSVECHETEWGEVAGERLSRERAVGQVWTGPCSSTEGSVLIDPYGDYSVGRYIWLLEDIRKLSEPIPAIGRQGIWKWEPQG